MDGYILRETVHITKQRHTGQLILIPRPCGLGMRLVNGTLIVHSLVPRPSITANMDTVEGLVKLQRRNDVRWTSGGVALLVNCSANACTA